MQLSQEYIVVMAHARTSSNECNSQRVTCTLCSQLCVSSKGGSSKR